MAAFLTQLGYFLWKISADSLPKNGPSLNLVVLKNLFSNWKWHLGMLSIIGGWILFIKASDLGEISLVEPLMSIGDLFLVLLTVIFLNERLSKYEGVGIALTVIGAVLLSFGAKSIAPVEIHWTNLYSLITFLILLSALLLYFNKKNQNLEINLAVIVGIGFGCGAILTELMTAYLAKTGQVLQSLSFILNPIFPFMMIANVFGLIVIQIAFQKGRAAVIVPVQLSVASAIAVLGGAIVFSEVISLQRVLGIIIILLGTIFLNGT